METTNEYEVQAIDFLKSTNTELIINYDRFDSMSWDDTGTKRNIFKCTLKNSKHSYTFEFGDSLQDSCKETPKLFSNPQETVEIYFGLAKREPQYRSVFSYKIITDIGALNKVYKGELQPVEILNESKLQESLNLTVEKLAKERFSFADANSIKRIDFKKKLLEQIDKKIQELLNEKVLINQKEEIVSPSVYDILVCLEKYEVGTFEDFCGNYGYDENSRKAFKTYKAVLKQYNNISKLFNEEQLELLREIQ